MAISSAKLLEYWRDCIADDVIAGIKFYALRDFPNLTIEELREGKVSAATVAAIRDAKAQEKWNNDSSSNFEVVVALGRISPSYVHGSAESDAGVTVPLWIPAVLTEDGALSPHETRHPFIARRSLEPSPNAFTTVGLLDDADSYYEKHVPDGAWRGNWDAAYAWALQLWEQVVGQPLLEFAPEDAHFELEYWLAPADAAMDAGKLTNCLIEASKGGNESRRLIERLVSDVTPNVSLQFDPRARSAHFGLHALSPDQRQTVDHVIGTLDGEIQAVNGPPGTGKTTLIRSAIAVCVVDAVRKSTDAMSAVPPIIVVTSTNNNAVTNVLDSCRSEGGDGYHRRWIDGVGDLGVYLASGTAKKSSSYNSWVFQGGSIRSFIESANVTKLTTEYLAKYNQSFSLPTEHDDKQSVSTSAQQLDGAVIDLRARVLAKQKNLEDIYDTWETYRSEIVPNEREATEEMTERHFADVVDDNRAVDEANDSYANALEKVERSVPHYQRAIGELQTKSLLEMLLSWVPAMKRRIYHRFELAFGEGAPDFGEFSQIEAATRAKIKALYEARDRAEATLNYVRDRSAEMKRRHTSERADFQAACRRWAERWATIRSAADVPQDPAEVTLEHLEAAMDLGIRRDSFALACRFWEGRWLAEMVKAQAQLWKGEAEAKVLMRFRLIAKLYPFYAVTLYSLPRRFNYFSGQPWPLLGKIDLLIVDEAGQVPAHLGAVGLVSSKRAIIIGDVDQLEPIVNVDESLSVENLKHRFGKDVDIEDVRQRGLLIHENGGSLMHVAQCATKYSLPNARVPGSFLSTHYRCVPEIIAYCDDLVYHGLAPNRKSIEKPLFPPMGYAHVRGRSEPRGKSRINESEARLVADFIASNAADIVSKYKHYLAGLPADRQLASLVAVVTPFASQARRIQALLRARLPNVETPVVGTAFAMQGAQAKVVIYSNVYSPGDGMGYANGKRNLLNVAVSRAEDYFLFFGDIGSIQKQPSSSPLGLLAQFLVGSAERAEANQLVGVPPAFYGDGAAVEHIDTPEKHYRLLDEAMRASSAFLLISSPFLGGAAKDVKIFGDLSAAAARGVDVQIYSDTKYAQGKEELGEHLGSSGASWTYVDRVHAKTLAVDSTMLYEGSFNWFGASRDPNLRNHEAGWLVRGAHAATAIVEVRKYFNDHVKRD